MLQFSVRNIVFTAVLVINVLKLSKCCHAPSRNKRQTSSVTSQVEATTRMRDFFVSCLRSKVGDIWDWESVIDFSVLDSAWYKNTDEIHCRVKRVSVYIVIYNFNYWCIDSLFAIKGNSTSSSGRKKRQAFPTVRRCTTYFANAPTTRLYNTCTTDNIVLPSDRRRLDFASLTEFVADNTLCTSELAECGSNNEETITAGDTSVPSWPFLFEAIALNTSPIKSVATSCNRIFPTARNDESRCGQWLNWSPCPANCAAGFRSRGRTCPADFRGNRTQTGRCLTNRPGCGNRFLSSYAFYRLLGLLIG
ncbi:uncharacterized protein LOC100184932 [Ciona intestinalis]